MENKESKMKKRGRFNIIDFLLIIFILLIIGASILILDPFSLFENEPIEKKTIEYTVEFNSISKDLSDMITIGENGIGQNANVIMGKIIAVDNSKDAYIWTIGENGKMKKVNDPTKSLIIVTFESEVDYKVGKGYFINDNRIAIGGMIDLKYPMDILGECVSITLK